jgi:hypothetical protein
MDYIEARAYLQGRVAGANHYFELKRNAAIKHPESPYNAGANAADSAWRRGFIDGFAQGKFGGYRLRSSEDRRQWRGVST